MSTPQRIVDYRRRQRRSGLRLVQMWVPDTRRRGFAAECARQAAAAARADAADSDLADFLDTALAQIDGWQP
ncbi:MAG: antitoxin MazE-like protein [Betaproteobacteria bacterium]|jgi:hypothetical protein